MNETIDEPWPRAVGIRKFVLMSLFTIGLYDVYWFYWNWRRQRDMKDPAVHAGLLTFLSPFVAYILFRDINAEARASAVTYAMTQPSWSPALLALAYFVCIMSFDFPGWWWMLTFVTFLPLIPIQQSINTMHAISPNGAAPDDTFTALNIAGMLCGFAVIALLITGGMWLQHGGMDTLQVRLDSLLLQQ